MPQKSRKKGVSAGEKPLPDGGWKKSMKIMGLEAYSISDGDMRILIARARARACARGSHHFIRPHSRSLLGGPCRCERRCMCGIFESQFEVQQRKARKRVRQKAPRKKSGRKKAA